MNENRYKKGFQGWLPRPVVAVKPDGSMGGYFESISAAVRLYGMDRHSISDSCRKGSICHGFRWMYDEEYREYWMNGQTHKLAYKLDPYRDRLTYHWLKGHKGGNSYAKLSEERKQQLRKARREDAVRLRKETLFGHPEITQIKAVRCITTGENFPSLTAAGKHYGIRPCRISESIATKRAYRELMFEFINQ